MIDRSRGPGKWLVVVVSMGVSWSTVLEAADERNWMLQASLYTTHHDHDPDHNNRQRLLGLEYSGLDDWLLGGATFRNSFSQRSAYIYAGRRFDHAEAPLFLKVTGGLLHGYRGEYSDKIPFNQLGIAPAIIPSLGVEHGRVSSELVVLGTAALMVNVGFRF